MEFLAFPQGELVLDVSSLPLGGLFGEKEGKIQLTKTILDSE